MRDYEIESLRMDLAAADKEIKKLRIENAILSRVSNDRAPWLLITLAVLLLIFRHG